MGKEFLDGYVSLADGEKDPRNLIVAFAIARVILIEFDIYERIEVIFCTFSLILANGFLDTLQHHLLLLPYYLPSAA